MKIQAVGPAALIQAESRMGLNACELGLVLDALRSHKEAIEAFLSDADDGDDVDSVRGDLVATKELEAKIKATMRW